MFLILGEASGLSGFQLLCLISGGGAMAAGFGWLFKVERSNAQLRAKVGLDGNGLSGRLDKLEKKLEKREEEGRGTAKELRRELQDLKIQLARMRSGE